MSWDRSQSVGPLQRAVPLTVSWFHLQSVSFFSRSVNFACSPLVPVTICGSQLQSLGSTYNPLVQLTNRWLRFRFVGFSTICGSTQNLLIPVTIRWLPLGHYSHLAIVSLCCNNQMLLHGLITGSILTASNFICAPEFLTYPSCFNSVLPTGHSRQRFFIQYSVRR